VGPRAEAERLYVRQSRLVERLEATADRALVVFDVGLGAGSNALAAWTAAEQAGAPSRLLLISFERDLGALALALAHAADFGMPPPGVTAARAVLATGHHETVRTSWRLAHGDVLEALQREPEKADIVFWDPFSPRANPELWTVAAFAAIRRAAGPRCTLFTYSASTAVRVALLLAGWTVGVGQPIGEKAATTAAASDLQDLVHPLDQSWLPRLSRRDVPLPGDAPADAATLIARLPQFA
jgi:queuine tRNA-ribosyltransferase